MGGALNCSGERFQNNAASLSGFTGFAWKADSCKKKYAAAKISGSCGHRVDDGRRH